MVLGLACLNCKLVIHKQYQNDDAKNIRFEFCPNCGKSSFDNNSVKSLDNYNDITDYENAMNYSMDVELYRQLYGMYMDSIRNNDGYRGVTFKKFAQNLVQSYLS